MTFLLKATLKTPIDEDDDDDDDDKKCYTANVH